MKHQWCDMGRRRFVVMRPMIGGGMSRVATVESRTVAEYLCDALDAAHEAQPKIGAEKPLLSAPDNVVSFPPVGEKVA